MPMQRIPTGRLVPLLALLIPLAAATVAPARASNCTWEDGDWSHGHYTMISQLDPDIHPGTLVLENRLNDWHDLGSPTQYQGLYCMQVYHDSLFLAASDYPFQFDGAEVLTYAYPTGQFAVDYEPYESGLNIIKQFGDSLYIPGPDPMDPWTDNGSIYVYGGHEWIEKETVPVAVHVCDVEICNGILYVTTGHWAGELQGRGCVWISYDYGDTFTRVLTIDPTPEHYARRFFGLGHFGDRVFAQPDGFPPVGGKVYSTTNGVDWDTIPVPSLPVDKHATFLEWNNTFFMMVDNRMYIWNGHAFQAYTMPFHGYRWCRGYHVYKGQLYGGGDSCILYRWLSGSQWESIGTVALDPSTEEIESIVTYYGRMYISTSRVSELDQAHLYVSGALPIGRLTSVIHDFGVGTQSGLITWDDYRPGAGTTRFQVRSGDSQDELLQNEFLGPDGTPATYYTEPGTLLAGFHNGHRFFQYLVDLICPNGLDMPFLDRVVLELDSLNVAGVDPHDPAGSGTAGGSEPAVHLLLEQPWPNPARGDVEVRLELHGGRRERALPVQVWILDPQGRVLRSTRIAASAQGPVSWRWDLRDDHGRRVPGGVYRAAFQIAGLRGDPITRPVVVLP
jgi:hypothetical protein